MNFYAVQHPVGKVIDDEGLRQAFIKAFDMADHPTIAKFGILYVKHLRDCFGISNPPFMDEMHLAIEDWLSGKTNFHPARNLAGALQDLARTEQDPFMARFDRTLAQAAAIPHIKFHGLWLTDFGISLINRRHPGDIEQVQKERQVQIDLLCSLLEISPSE